MKLGCRFSGIIDTGIYATLASFDFIVILFSGNFCIDHGSFIRAAINSYQSDSSFITPPLRERWYTSAFTTTTPATYLSLEPT